MAISLYVLDVNGDPVLAADPTSYGAALLDPRRSIGTMRIDIPNGFVLIQTEFVGVDFDASGRLWQTFVQWSSMLGQSTSFARWASAAEATQGHADLVTALQVAAAAINAQ